MDGGFDREGGIADSSRARRERNHDRRFGRDIVSRGRADPPDNFENFLRQSGLGDPVGVSGLNEPLVVAGGNVAANDDEEYVSRIAPDDVDQIVDVRMLGRRRDQDDDRSFRAVDRFRIDVFDSRNPLEVWNRRLEFAPRSRRRSLRTSSSHRRPCEGGR